MTGATTTQWEHTKMLIKQTETDLMSGGLGEGNDFKIAASAKAFDILSSNLYQNKILAVVREVSCNAADAHRMVNKPLSDIEIVLPTWGAPTFSVRDFGPGLSHKSMLHLYTTFFMSDKDKSNYLIGGLGLGSKSPFSIADQFIVTSWHDGVKRQYICFKNNGIPAINLTSEAPSSEPSGLKVEVVATTNRLGDWATEAGNYFRWWPELPSITNGPAIEPIFNKDSLLLASSTLIGGLPSWAFSPALSNPVVYMGMVPYALNFSALPQLPADVGAALSSSGLVMVFPIGELEINPSRETLSYNPATCQALCGRLASIYKSVQTEIEAKLASATSLYEARQIVFSGVNDNGTDMKDLLKQITKNTKFKPKWQGHNVDPVVSTDFTGLAQLPQYFVTQRTSWRSNWRKSGPHDFQHTDLQDSSTAHSYRRERRIYCHTVGPITGKTYRTVQHYAETLFPDNAVDRYGNKIRHDITVNILVHPSFTDVEAHLHAAGFPPILKVEDMPAPPKTVSAGRTSTSSKTQAYTISGGSYERTEKELDLKGGGFYMLFHQGHPIHSLMAMSSLKLLLDPTGTLPIVGLAERRLKVKALQKALAKEGWTELTPAAITLAQPSVLQHTVKLSQLLGTYDVNARRLSPYLKDSWKHLFSIDTTGLAVPAEWAKHAAVVAEVRRFSPPMSTIWETFTNHLTDAQKQAIVDGKLEADAIHSDMDAWFKKHPLLSHLKDYAYADLSALDIFDYINR